MEQKYDLYYETSRLILIKANITKEQAIKFGETLSAAERSHLKIKSHDKFLDRDFER